MEGKYKCFALTLQIHTRSSSKNRMLDTAFTSAAIAIGAGAAIILLSSRSITLTIFSAATIGFVLTSVTACLVSLGWSLGFLESICFAILIVSPFYAFALIFYSQLKSLFIRVFRVILLFIFPIPTPFSRVTTIGVCAPNMHSFKWDLRFWRLPLLQWLQPLSCYLQLLHSFRSLPPFFS